MRVLGIIPARGGSKGVVDKNIKDLNGKPLIQYTIDEALKSELTSVIVSTDSEVIKQKCIELGANVPFLRPSHLAEDSSSSISVVQHALDILERDNGEFYDAVMLLQPTCPFRNTEDINQVISLFEVNQVDSVISVCNVDGNHPARMKYLSNDMILVDPPFAEEYENQPRQELTRVYIRNGAIYLTKSSVIKEKSSFKGQTSYGYVMDSSRSINIDTYFDFEIAEALMSLRK